MSVMINVRMGYEPERTSAFGAIGATYAVVGNLFTHPIKILVLQNGTNAAVTYSLDGVNDLITLQAGISIVLDISTNFAQEYGAAPINWGVYVKSAGAPTTGAVYASAVYGANPQSV
jgi:hypothetical protein